MFIPSTVQKSRQTSRKRPSGPKPGSPRLAELARNTAPDEAVALYRAGRHAEALARAEEALSAMPGSADACSNLGVIFKGAGRLEQAESAYCRAIALNPAHPAAHYNLGNLLRETGRSDEAEAAYRKAITLHPGYADAYNNLGKLFLDIKRFDEAEAACRQAIALHPAYVEAYCNLGILHQELKRFDEAETAYRQAIALRPGYADAHNNLGNLLNGLMRHDEAEAAYRQSIVLQPDNTKIRWNLSLLLLALGRFEEAWPLYETRYHPSREKYPPPTLPFPRWQGEPLSGKSLLVVTEQGFGDTIQFTRYASLLKTMGATRITLVCQSPLIELLRTAPGIDTVVSLDGSVPEHDYWSFLLSLPGLCGTTLTNIPASLPYLRADHRRVEAWRPRLPPPVFRVGLVWKGRGTHTNDANRSLPGLETLASLWRVPGVSFVSLQRGVEEGGASVPLPPGLPLTHLGADIQDFADTAAIVSQLDLVICVDTAVAHLAGALGKPCWVMLPHFGADWRWLLERTDSPWYPGVMRLFRQGAEESWGEVVAAVAGALRGAVARGPETNCTPPQVALSQTPPPADVATDEAVAFYR